MGTRILRVDPERARQRLSDERARVERELAEHGDDANALDELKRTLRAIDKAEQRLADGSYGKSVVSGDPIPDERLEAVPWAERTVEEEQRSRG
jgi:DnaK suppressor protein